MKNTAISVFARQLSLRHLRAGKKFSSRLLSSKVKPTLDASKFVSGITNESLENDPALMAFYTSNFPEYSKDVKDQQARDILESSPPELRKYFIDTVPAFRKVARIDQGDDSLPKLPQEKDYWTEIRQKSKKTPNTNIRSLLCYSRDESEEEGTRKCNKLREKHKMIPGLLYGSDPTQDILSIDHSSKIFVKTPWSQIQRELDIFTHNAFESRVYDLTLYENEEDKEGTVHRVLPRDVQYHPVQHKVYCCNYLRYFPGRPIKIPIVYTNQDDSAVMKRGGFIAPISRTVSCVLEDGIPIPEAIELDCTGVKLKDVLRLERLTFPEGVKLDKNVDKDQFLVGTVFGSRSGIDTDEDEDQSETPTSEPN